MRYIKHITFVLATVLWFSLSINAQTCLLFYDSEIGAAYNDVTRTNTEMAANGFTVSGPFNITAHASYTWTNYDMVMIIAGDAVDPFDVAAERTAIINYAQTAGSRLFITGGEFGWDMRATANFFDDVMHSKAVSSSPWYGDVSGHPTENFAHAIVSTPNDLATTIYDDHTGDAYDWDSMDQDQLAGVTDVWVVGADETQLRVYESGSTRHVMLHMTYHHLEGASNAASLRDNLIENIGEWLKPAGATWDGSFDSDWKTAANWSTNAVPGAGTDVIIPTSGSYTNAPIVDETDAVCKDLTVQSGGTLTINAASSKLDCAGTLSLNSGGTIIITQGELECETTFTYSGALTMNHADAILDVNGNIAMASTLTESISLGNIYLTGNITEGTEDGGFTPTGGTINFDGTSATTAALDASSNFYNIVLNKTTNGLTAASNLTINGTNTVTDGNFSVSTYTVTTAGTTDINDYLTIGTGTYNGDGNFDATGATIDFTGAGKLILSGATVTSLGTLDILAGTVEYDRAGAQTIKADTYFNLEIDGSGSKTCEGTTNVDGKLTVSAGTMALSSTTTTVKGISDINATLQISTGTFNADGDFDATGGTIDFTGAGRIILSSTITSLGTLDTGAGTIEYDNAGAQTIEADTYYSLEIDGSGTKTLGGAIITNDDLVISTGTLDVSGSNYAITCNGDFVRTDAAVFTAQSGTVTFGGSAAQRINVESVGGTDPTDSDLTFNHLIIDGTDVRLYTNDASYSTNVAGNLTVNSGKTLNLYDED